MPFLRVRVIDGTESVHVIAGQSLTFGRADGNDLVLNARGVSRRHGRLLRTSDGDWWLEDLDSMNGTLVAGRYVARHRLRHDDPITVGDATLIFQADEPDAPKHPAAAVTIADLPSMRQPPIERPPSATSAMDRQRLAALYEISKRLLDQRDVNSLIEVAAAELIATLGAEVVVFGLTCDPEGEPDRLVVRPPQMARAEVTLSRSILRRTIQDRQAILVPDTTSDRDLNLAHSIVAGGICSALCVPMLRDHDVTGFIYLDSRQRMQAYGEADLEFASAVGAMVGTAIENARLHENELVNQRIQAELASARQVQQAIMPTRWPRIAGWDVAGRHTMCYHVGGDYYHARATDDGRLWLIVADVAGKGIPAALMSTSIHAALCAILPGCQGPAELLTKLNDLLMQRVADQPFVTCVAVMISRDRQHALVASAGHPHPVFAAVGGPAEVVPIESHLILGLEPEVKYVDTMWSFPAGGTLVLHTDGLSEAVNDNDQQFGVAGLLQALTACAATSADAAIDALLVALDDFRGPVPQHDDLTILAYNHCPART